MIKRYMSLILGILGIIFFIIGLLGATGIVSMGNFTWVALLLALVFTPLGWGALKKS